MRDIFETKSADGCTDSLRAPSVRIDSAKVSYSIYITDLLGKQDQLPRLARRVHPARPRRNFHRTIVFIALPYSRGAPAPPLPIQIVLNRVRARQSTGSRQIAVFPSFPLLPRPVRKRWLATVANFQDNRTRAAQAVTTAKFRLPTTADYVTRILPWPPPPPPGATPRPIAHDLIQVFQVHARIHVREIYVLRLILGLGMPRYNGIHLGNLQIDVSTMISRQRFTLYCVEMPEGDLIAIKCNYVEDERRMNRIDA